MQRLRSFLKLAALRYAVVSFESLALWRVMLGLACVHVVLRRWGMLGLFYTETGAYPLAALPNQPAWTFGPLRWLTTAPELHAAFALCLLITLAFTAGLGTRVVKWLLLPVLFSIDARTPALLSGGAQVLHLQALYAVLFPLGRALSLDSWLKKRATETPNAPPEPTAIQTLAYPLVLLQLAVIYLFNVLAKSGETWHDGTAVARALGAATLVTDFGAWLARAPAPVLHALTTGTLIIEGCLPVLLLSPWHRRYMHGVAAALIVALHGGILLALELGSFSIAMICHVPLLWHGGAREARVEVPPARQRRWQALAVAALTYLMAARLGNDLLLFPDRPQLPLPIAINRITHAMCLLQSWMMFSPDPPEREYVIVTDAVTRRGRHFDPWRQVVSGRSELYQQVPVPVARALAFTRYESSLARSQHATMHPFFARWVLAQRWGDDPVERFDTWAMVVPTDRRYVVPEATVDERAGVMPLPAPLLDALAIASVRTRGVWAPERALDGKIVPEGGNDLTPTSAIMSAGCPSLTLDLGEQRTVQSAFFQADAEDHFLIEGSLDGSGFHPLGEMPRVAEQLLRSRVVTLSVEPVRFVRIRPAISRRFRHYLSEVAFFDRAVSLPNLPSRTDDPFVTSLARPSVVGIVSGSNHPSPDCPAEAVLTAKAP
jgi:hypothetical protein